MQWRWRLQHVTTLVLVEESDGALPPVDLRVDSLQPRHAEDGIIAGQSESDEVERVGVRTDSERCSQRDAGSGLLAAVSQSDEV